MSTLKRYNGTSWETIGGSITGDTLPIGSEIDYTGSSVPAGWEEVADYSTNEINTGKTWIDGKPIYRKVLTGTLNSTEYTVMTNVGNLNIINTSGWMQLSATVKQCIPGYANENNYSHIYVVNTDLRLISPSIWNNSSYIIIIEYTKTTD